MQRLLDRAGASAFGRALRLSGFTDDLGCLGPFTLFAPSDAALAELPPELLEHPAHLHRVLGFHLIEGAAMRIFELERTLGSSIGQRLHIERTSDGSVAVDGAQLVCRDLPLGAGIVHIIDRVLMPAELDLLELLHISDSFHRLVMACETLELERLLRGALPYTLLAPRGLLQLPTWHWHALLRPSGHAQLREIIHRHLVPGRWYLEPGMQLRNLDGGVMRVERSGGSHRIEGRRVLIGDIDARNGLVHVLEGLHLP